jgi:hypothetical protein
MSVRRQAALAAVVAVLVGGCSGEPEPRFEEPTSSATPSESPSPEMRPTSPRATVAEWIEIYNEFEKSGDATELRALATRCTSCEDVIKVVASAYDRGGFVRSGGWQLKGRPAVLYSRPRSAGVRAVVEVAPSRYKASSNSRVERGPGGTVTMDFDLRRIHAEWRIWQWTRRATT